MQSASSVVGIERGKVEELIASYPQESIGGASLEQLNSLYATLQQDFAVDYKQMYEVAKSVKSLDRDMRRLAEKYLGDNERKGEYESESGEEEEEEEARGHNLLETVMQHAERALEDEAHLKAAIQKRWWTAEEDAKLKRLVEEHHGKNWKTIASHFEERSDVQCLHRWQKVLNPQLIKGPWVAVRLCRPRKRTTSCCGW